MFMKTNLQNAEFYKITMGMIIIFLHWVSLAYFSKEKGKDWTKNVS